jgi:short-subunit dehydrogenase
MTTERRTDQVVVITGASAGVGRATARAFAARGASVALLAREESRLESARREMEEAGGHAISIPADVADPDQVEAAAQTIEDALGPIDTWINNAMAAVFAPVAETSAEEFRRVTEVTYLGAVYGTLAALKRMLPRNRGKIIQVGSALAYRAIPLQASYCAAKHAIEGFTESLRIELRHERSKVRVSLVQLPALNTPQFEWVRARMPRQPQPVPPIFEPELAAEAIVWAGERGKREVWVGWPVVKALLADKLAPRAADRYLARNGYASQQTEDELDAERGGNLFEPVAGEFGARGRFSGRARRRSWQFALRRWL